MSIKGEGKCAGDVCITHQQSGVTTRLRMLDMVTAPGTHFSRIKLENRCGYTNKYEYEHVSTG